MAEPTQEPPAVAPAHAKKREKLLPVTLISGFLGAGKSTLLRNILEAKKADDESFRCAVLVNDMAELNIDTSLIAASGLVRSDEVVSMQNGCVCCNLSGDLIEQIVGLASNRETPFDYLVIEASGVSEPAAIAALFEDCHEDDDDDDHHHQHGEHEAGGPTSLGSVARMDTIATVVDSAEFLQNLEGMDDPDRGADYPRLLVDQVECSNVVLLNKTDLVSEPQLREVRDKVTLLAREGVRVLACQNADVDVKHVLDTGLYRSGDFDLSKFVERFASGNDEKPKACCKKAEARGESPCCKRARTIDSGKSRVLLPSKKVGKTRHGEDYKITSFVYKARRPFAPGRFFERFVDAFFVMEEDPDEEEDDGEDEDDEAGTETDVDPPPKKKPRAGSGDEGAAIGTDETNEESSPPPPEEADGAVRAMQETGAARKAKRTEALGSLLRAKGYLWQANSHDLVGYISTAGNAARLETLGRWKCLEPSSYPPARAPESSKADRGTWVAPYGDRRQELVFIGQDLRHVELQRLLDEYLLSDEEMALGVDGWKATFGDIMLDA